MNAPERIPNQAWRKSSYSNGNGGCVGWAPAHIPTTGTVPVRDSKDPAGPVLTLTPATGSSVAGRGDKAY